MDSPAALRNIRDKLRAGGFGQREVWEAELETAAAEIERLRTEKQYALDVLHAAEGEIERLRAALQEIVRGDIHHKDLPNGGGQTWAGPLAIIAKRALGLNGLEQKAGES